MDKTTRAPTAHSIDARKGETKVREVPFAAQNLSKLPDDARIDVKSVASILGIGVSTAWSWVARGLLPQPSRLGRTTRWRAGSIREIAAGGQ
jgi:predicted DNA-binding transcriptional regulator AlpA